MQAGDAEGTVAFSVAYAVSVAAHYTLAKFWALPSERRDTLRQFRAGTEPPVIARQRGVTEGTVYGHLAAALDAGEELEMRRFFTPEEEREMTAAFDRTGWAMLSGAHTALGGRYDEVGKAFGRARPATGFSMDLRELAQVAAAMPDPVGIRAPYADDPELGAEIERLRSKGEMVIVELPGHESSQAAGCDRELARMDGQWTLRKLD